MVHSSLKPLSLQTVASALENVIPDSILFTAIPLPEIDFSREIITVKPIKDKIVNTPSVAQLLSDSGDKETFYVNF